MRDHHDHRAGHADEVEAGDAQKAKANMGDARIADEPIQVALAHRHPAAIQNVAQAERGHHRDPLLRPLRHQGQGNAEESVETEFLEYTRVQHRGGGWR